MSVTVAVPNVTPSDWLVALMVACCGELIVGGAVYNPPDVIVPAVAVHVTAVLAVPVTDAVKFCCPLAVRVAVPGDTVTAIAVVPLDDAVPLTSTRSPVGFAEVPKLVTTKSRVFKPVINPELIVNAVKALNEELELPVLTPLSLMMVELSPAYWPVITAVAGLSPARLNVVRYV